MSLIAGLTDAVGAEHVLLDAELCRSYESDWTGRYRGRSSAVVRPATTEQVAAVVRTCSQHRIPLQVQGGNTGLVGGSVPTGGEVLLSLTRLGELADIDSAAAQVTAGAGVTLAALQTHARAAGLDFGVDLAARDSATLGGLAATNAGGVRVLRHGSMRAQVLGVEAVLADGSVVSRLGGLTKDGTGYDLSALLCGSEGTLGIITRLRLRLVPRLSARAVALLALPDTRAAVDVLPVLRRLGSLSAAEVLYTEGLDLVAVHTGLSAPFADRRGCFLLVECAARADPTDELVAALAEAPEVLDALVASDATGMRALWAYREKHTEALSAAGVPVKLDVAVPVAHLPELVERLEPTVTAVVPQARTVVFGHINEGNLHVNVLDAQHAAGAVTDAVLHLVAEAGGSISSEHGVGRAKTAWLGLSRSPAEIAAMRSIRGALDPQGLLNPGVLFCAEAALPPAV